jgi:hypothetical protein
MSHPEKRPVTIEDLLRLKATERPPAEFWEKFDRELRAKQLAALVQKRPWWQRMPDFFAGWRRYPLPLGAAAALAVTFLSVREFSRSDSTPPGPAGGAVVAGVVRERSAPEGPINMGSAGTMAAKASELNDVALNNAAASREFAAAAEPMVAASTGVAPGEVARLVNHLPVEERATGNSLAPSARHIAANLAAATEAAEPVIGGGLLDANRSRTGASRAVEPLAQVNSPSGARLAKFRSAMAVSVAQVSFGRGDERVVRELNDRLTEEAVRRITAKGNELSMKF